jgi:hypothetical protein
VNQNGESREHGNKKPGSIGGSDICDQSTDLLLRKKDSVPWS